MRAGATEAAAKRHRSGRYALGSHKGLFQLCAGDAVSTRQLLLRCWPCSVLTRKLFIGMFKSERVSFVYTLVCWRSDGSSGAACRKTSHPGGREAGQAWCAHHSLELHPLSRIPPQQPLSSALLFITTLRVSSACSSVHRGAHWFSSRWSNLSFAAVGSVHSGWPYIYVPSCRTAWPGLKLLEEFGTVDASYDLTPEQLVERIPSCDALIIRSATKVLAFGKGGVSMDRALNCAICH